MKKVLALSALACATVAPSVMAAEEVNVYSYRQPFLIEPMFDKFTKETGIKVNVKFAKKGMAEKVKQEGELSPADVLLTVDISRLSEFKKHGVVQAVDNKVLEANIPAIYQDADNEWFALTKRSRSVYSSRDRVGRLGEDFTYADLATPKFKGKICTRSGKHPYNVSLVASIIAHEGEAAAKAWLEGVKDNLARKPQGNDRAQVKAIKEGLCDVSLGNSYYLGKMLNNEEQQAWAEAVYLNYPNQKTTGTHVNISGMALAKHSPNKENAIKLMEFLASNTAQSMYAEVNFEEPIKAGVKSSELVSSWGEYRADDLSLADIASRYETAVKLIDEVKFDL